MLAFAGNSILNRYALVDGDSGAWTFTLIRLISGAVMLALLSGFRIRGGSWAGALALLLYAGGFSFAYLAMDAGLGALILFAMVQFTMLGAGIAAGERLSLIQGGGAFIAFAAMIWLLFPEAGNADFQSPALWAVGAMSAAGTGWGVYSLIGRGAAQPLLVTSGNFTRAALIAVILTLPLLSIWPEGRPSTGAILAAMASGAITSGLGYAIWYAVLPKLSRMQAGLMQLSVPAIAAIGGVMILGEVLTPRLMISTALILAGVGAATISRRKVL